MTVGGDNDSPRYVSGALTVGTMAAHYRLLSLVGSGGMGDVYLAEIACQVGEVLNPPHQAGIVHRDLKPSNIIIDRQGRAHLMDFGLVAVAEDGGGSAV